ncbi:MAG: iron ABC transporter permease [Pseudomonadota bacterium]|nr:iron ABC transporter permease [Pseudomonadota bacterium]
MTAAGRASSGGRSRAGGAAVAAGLALLLALAALWSLRIGATEIPTRTLFAAVFSPDPDAHAHAVLRAVRLPRLLTGLIAGGALAAAGAIMQAATGNPLASPGLLGINAGAAFAVVCASILAPGAAMGTLVGWAFAGAAMAAAAVYAAGSAGRGGATSAKLALAGAILSAFIGSLTAAALIFDTGSLDAVRAWTVGSVEGRSPQAVAAAAPWAAAGLAAALIFSRQVTTLSLGAEVARQVGQNVLLWRALCAVAVVMLAGSAVALAGPIGFVGLMAPHAARLAVGTDFARLLPVAALGGAALVVGADAALRAGLPGRDVPVGVGMALLGAPAFIWFVRGRAGRRAGAAA